MVSGCRLLYNDIFITKNVVYTRTKCASQARVEPVPRCAQGAEGHFTIRFYWGDQRERERERERGGGTKMMMMTRARAQEGKDLNFLRGHKTSHATKPDAAGRSGLGHL
jgi:hypothetical protein